MGLDKLEEALLWQRQDFAETEMVPLIAKVLEIEEIERATVRRVVAAFLCLIDQPRFKEPFHEDSAWRALIALPDDVFAAIEVAMHEAMQRARMARHIGMDEPLNVFASQLVGDNVKGICEGCPQRLHCIAQNLSTPENCHKFRIVQVTVLSLKGTTIRVTAEHPKGEYSLNITGLPYLDYIPDPFLEVK